MKTNTSKLPKHTYYTSVRAYIHLWFLKYGMYTLLWKVRFCIMHIIQNKIFSNYIRYARCPQSFYGCRENPPRRYYSNRKIARTK